MTTIPRIVNRNVPIPPNERRPMPRLQPPASRVGRPFAFLWSIWLRMPSRVRLTIYELLWSLGCKLYGRGSTFTQRLPFGLYAKSGIKIRYSEAAAMKFVAEHTSIPMPIVLDVLWEPYGVFILMTRVPGVPFGENFGLEDLSPDELTDFENTLQDWFKQLRSVPLPTTDAISSFDGTMCRSYRVMEDKDFGPFANEAEFNAFLLRTVNKKHHEELLAKRDALGLTDTRHRICFTHGDIHPNNFLFHNGRLSAFIDWECAGWYPDYWEFTRAVYMRTEYKLWFDIFQRIFPRYSRELEMEDAFWMVHNPW